MFRDLLLRERAAENDFWDGQDHIHEVIQAGQSHFPVHRHALLCDQYHDFTEEVRYPTSILLPQPRKVMMPSQQSGIPRVCYSYDGSSTPANHSEVALLHGCFGLCRRSRSDMHFPVAIGNV